MATYTSRNQAPSPGTQEDKNRSGQPTNPLLANRFNVAHARVISLILAASLCNALAGQVLHAMSAADPWWLGDAASLTIRAFGVDIANRSKVSEDYRLILHLSVVALGWALDKFFLALGVFIR